MIDKKRLLKAMIDQLEKDRTAAMNAAKATYEAATHEESKPENQYDTRGLEASYLAGAQEKRVFELEELLAICKHLNLKSFSENDPISSTALVEIELNGKKNFVFLMPKGGGQILSFEGHSVQVITPASPLGEALLGLRVGDSAIVEMDSGSKEYEILSVE